MQYAALEEKNCHVICIRPIVYRKIPIISPGLIFVQKGFLLGLFSGELIFGGACYRKNFAFQNKFGLSIKTAKNTKITA